MERERGAQPVFLASCSRQCEFEYHSPVKYFSIFGSDRYSIQICDGIGIIELDPEKVSNEDDEDDYEDFFEVVNGESTECEFRDLAKRAETIWEHLREELEILYGTEITNLELSFGVKSIDNSYKLFLLDVFSCRMEDRDHFQMFVTVPDGIDCITQMIVAWGRCDWDNGECFCRHEACQKASTRLALSAVLAFKISEIFFDCDVDDITNYVKRQLRIVERTALDKPVGLCTNCYYMHQIFEQGRRRGGTEVGSHTQTWKSRSLQSQAIIPPRKTKLRTSVELPRKQSVPQVVKRLLKPGKPRISIGGNYSVSEPASRTFMRSSMSIITSPQKKRGRLSRVAPLNQTL